MSTDQHEWEKLASSGAALEKSYAAYLAADGRTADDQTRWENLVVLAELGERWRGKWSPEREQVFDSAKRHGWNGANLSIAHDAALAWRDVRDVVDDKRRQQIIESVATQDLLKMQGRELAKQRFKEEKAEQDATRNLLRIRTAEQFLFSTEPKPPPLWGDQDHAMWLSGESLMLFGPPGGCKTTLAFLVVLGRLSIIKEVLGMPVHDDGGKVLAVVADRPRQAERAMRRVPEIADPVNRAILSDRFVVHEGPLPFDITTDKNALADLCQRHEATTVMIDSIKDVCAKPSEEDTANGYNIARQEAVARGIEWIEIHHNRKASGDNKKPTQLDDVYGSRFLTAGGGPIYCLWGRNGSPVVEFTAVRESQGHFPDSKLVVDFATGHIALVGSDSTPTTPLECLLQAGAAGVSAEEVAHTLQKTNVEGVRRQLNRFAATKTSRGKPTNPIARKETVSGRVRYYSLATGAVDQRPVCPGCQERMEPGNKWCGGRECTRQGTLGDPDGS